ncbi:MAG: hypothetical protein HPY89_08185 [Pelotomaculum sp.]|nr:hypothetical protein [Pelotomaculum sp.]
MGRHRIGKHRKGDTFVREKTGSATLISLEKNYETEDVPADNPSITGRKNGMEKK